VSKLFTAIATLTGTVIGAGFLGIPYVVSKSGFLIGLGWMIGISVIMLLVNLALGEIILSNKRLHHIPGYVSEYLGRRTKVFILVASLIGFYSALIAYLVGGGESLSFLFTGSLKYSLLAGSLFWVLFMAITIRGIREFKKIEPLGVLAVFITTLIIGIISINKIKISNLSYVNPGLFFVPFGVILFAFLGVSSIPEMKRVLGKNSRLMKKAIIIGSLIPLIVYVLFTIVVLGFYGQKVFEIATISFGRIVTFFGILTMFTAFLALNLSLRDTFMLDYKMHFKDAWVLSTIIPFIFFFVIKALNLARFVEILGVGGSVSGGLLGIFILITHEKIKRAKLNRKPEYKVNIPLSLKVIFILVFLAGMVFELL